MTPGRALAHRHRWPAAVGLAVALTVAVLASLTRPFTGGADAVTALPLAVAAGAAVVRMRSPRPDPMVPGLGRAVTAHRRWLVWAAAAAVIAGWELYCYTAAPRSEHPTLSSLLDTLDSTHAGKAIAFALWLALGWYLVRP